MYQNRAYFDPRKSSFVKEIEKNDGTLPPLLYELFRRATPYGTEHHIINLLPFKEQGNVDKAGNFYISIGKDPHVMFSCHMDTVHTIPKDLLAAGTPGIIRLVKVDNPDDPQARGFVYGATRVIDPKDDTKFSYRGIVLGGDDKIGVYTLCAMIEKKIPGLYVFHVGEECGAHGSKHISETTPSLVKKITHCIAFDRMGYTDIISRQRGDRTASATFTHELARRLNEHINPKGNVAYTFKGEVTGMFTDSCSYKDIIHECTNVSVGYAGAHTADESFDAEWYFGWFLPAVLKLNWQTLPVGRDCKEKPVAQVYSYGTGTRETWINGKRVDNNSITAVAFDKINSRTFKCDLPKWTLTDGLNEEATAEGMERLIDNWSQENFQARSRQILNMLMTMAELEGEVMALTCENETLKEALKFSTSVVAKLPSSKFAANLQFKLTNVQSMIDLLDTKGMENIERNLFIKEARTFRKIAKRLRQRHASCTYEDYILINKCMITIMGTMPEDPSAGLAVVVKNCLKHIVENITEEGYEEVSANADKLLKVIEEMTSEEPKTEVAA